MRRIAVFLCVNILLFLAFGCQKQPSYGVYEITLSSTLLSNQSIGNDWETVYTYNGQTIASGKQWTAPLDSAEQVILSVTVTENDKWPDVGSSSLSVILEDDFEASTIVTVTENKGAYAGRQAQWEITCRVTLVETLT